MTPEEMESARRAAHLAKRGKKGASDAAQRTQAILQRDGSTYHTHPAQEGRGMWCAKGWEPDWERNYPVYEIKAPVSRV